jgi:hypothetical protein
MNATRFSKESIMDIYIPNKYCPCTRCRMRKMMLPVMLVTLGGLLLADHFAGMREGTILAVMLIVFGAVRLLQSSASMDGHRQPGELPASSIPPVPEEPSGTPSTEVQNG